eukprot:TRINITY_DN2253_c0_g5_i1.p1 TRINITY_DN2253_c0_g5~~TRINITY_DN2253_c0_g5_i1.p1  ORF type:complete len:196 (-),score=70.87 TRINITY_DN2253_c0_g5_i1:70-657(-)
MGIIKMLSKFLRPLLKAPFLLPLRFTSNATAGSIEPAENLWKVNLEELRKAAIEKLNARELTQYLAKLSKFRDMEIPSDVKKALDEYFEDNFQKIGVSEVVELLKHCSLIKGTEDCFWIWYNGERIIKTGIFDLSKQEVVDLAVALSRKCEGSDTLWYDIYRAIAKYEMTLSTLFTTRSRFNNKVITQQRHVPKI